MHGEIQFMSFLMLMNFAALIMGKKVKVKVKQNRYRSVVAQRVPGS
jgi:hypothetical protein